MAGAIPGARDTGPVDQLFDTGEPPRAHARGQRTVERLGGGLFLGRVEQTLHNGEV